MKRRATGCHSARPYERTQIGMCYRIFYNQVFNSKKREHTPPSYTKEELAKWIISQKNFESLYNEWVESDYTSKLRPSCDRLNNTLGYTFENIELVTWEENKKRANKDVTCNILVTNQTEVYQYLPSGKFVTHYLSIADACRKDTTLDQRNITACCQGKIPTAYGYIWSYIDLGNSILPVEVNTSYLCEIFQYSPMTGDIVNVYESILHIPEPEFCRMKVRNVISGVYYTHNGYFWSKEYLSPEDVSINTTYLPKQVLQLTKDNELVATFSSMCEAGRVTGLRAGNISKVCNGKAKSAGGYLWKHV